MPEIMVSWGEVLDKKTILSIKLQKITDETKLEFVLKEHQYLADKLHEGYKNGAYNLIEYNSYAEKLYNVNLKLWDIEDSLREMEDRGEFGETFVESARQVYKLNDKRFQFKHEFNILSQSELQEQKSYV